MIDTYIQKVISFRFFFFKDSSSKHVNMMGHRHELTIFFPPERIWVCAAVDTLILPLVPMIDIGERAGQGWRGHFEPEKGIKLTSLMQPEATSLT